jgi:formylglycine-generating enzyme required for sulfatase activity
LRSLSPWSELLPRLWGAIGVEIPTAEVDVSEVVDALGQAHQLDRLPLERRRRLATHLQVILDRSDRLVPFWDDQDLVAAALRALVPRHRLTMGVIHEGLDEPRLLTADGSSKAYGLPPMGGVVLVLGDLGCLDHGGDEAVGQWRGLGRRIAAAGCIGAALLPAPLVRCPADLKAVWRAVPWERSAPGAGGQEQEGLRQRADRLLALASPSVRIEPGLLRDIRRGMDPAAADAGTEADVWQHAAIASRSPVAASLHPEAAKQLRTVFCAEPAETQRAVLRLMRRWRHGLADEIWFEEILNLPPEAHSDMLEDVEDAQRFFAFLDASHGAVTGRAADVASWLDRVGSRATEDGWSQQELARAVYAVKQREPDFVPHAVVDPIEISSEQPEQVLELRQRGRSLVVAHAGDGTSALGSLIGTARSCNGLVRIAASDAAPANEEVSWAAGRAPSWADDWGRDEYGVWTSFAVDTVEGSRVVQRLRWISPGTFRMGSPEDEEGRNENEGPCRQVRFAQGFWMFETACTVALWKAVMGEPVRVTAGPPFPVTNVSWEDAFRFCARLNAMRPGLDLNLPTEAQWEYACRGGTQTPYSFGSEISRSLVNYGSDGPVPVGALPPNRWGLYEMHGNVSEWCSDHWHNSYDGAPTDGSSWTEGEESTAARVNRGGSWGHAAHYARAACRSLDSPRNFFVILGFRCVQTGASVATPAGRTGRRSAERRLVDAAILRCDEASSLLATLPRVRRLTIQTDRDELWLGRLTRPDWASAIGRDRFGLYADLTIQGLSGGDVTQRLRWVPPGRFTMGSPVDEEGRFEDEGPQHEVRLAEGFWLFDTPCTQELWEAVTGENPAQFKSPTRPVEQVSFEDVQRFIARLNDRVPGLELSLPSEAQWEYACRAGTQAATHAGLMQILGENNAPVLDEIAWYSGNSGVGFELADGFDTRDWPEKQYPHERAGTRPVKLKASNSWGLYDTLGNVWEWCADEWHDTYDGAPSDGSAWLGSEGGAAGRVVRGGSWDDDARSSAPRTGSASTRRSATMASAFAVPEFRS